MLSIQSKFNEVVASLTKAKLLETFNKKFTDRTKCPIEVQLNAGLEVLKAAGIVESINESGWALTFAPKTKIRKNNGADFTESAEQIKEIAVVTKKEALVESVRKRHNMTENEARGVMGLKPKAPADLKPFQVTEYRHFLKMGLNESDAHRCAKLPLRTPRA
jgi:hypothetical protein